MSSSAKRHIFSGVVKARRTKNNAVEQAEDKGCCIIVEEPSGKCGDTQQEAYTTYVSKSTKKVEYNEFSFFENGQTSNELYSDELDDKNNFSFAPGSEYDIDNNSEVSTKVSSDYELASPQLSRSNSLDQHRATDYLIQEDWVEQTGNSLTLSKMGEDVLVKLSEGLKSNYLNENTGKHLTLVEQLISRVFCSIKTRKSIVSLDEVIEERKELELFNSFIESLLKVYESDLEENELEETKWPKLVCSSTNPNSTKEDKALDGIQLVSFIGNFIKFRLNNFKEVADFPTKSGSKQEKDYLVYLTYMKKIIKDKKLREIFIKYTQLRMLSCWPVNGFKDSENFIRSNYVEEYNGMCLPLVEELVSRAFCSIENQYEKVGKSTVNLDEIVEKKKGLELLNSFIDNLFEIYKSDLGEDGLPKPIWSPINPNTTEADKIRDGEQVENFISSFIKLRLNNFKEVIEVSTGFKSKQEKAYLAYMEKLITDEQLRKLFIEYTIMRILSCWTMLGLDDSAIYIALSYIKKYNEFPQA